MSQISEEQLQAWKQQAEALFGQSQYAESGWRIIGFGYRDLGKYHPTHAANIYLLIENHQSTYRSQTGVLAYPVSTNQVKDIVSWQIHPKNPEFAGASIKQACVLLAKAYVAQLGDPDRRYQLLWNEHSQTAGLYFFGGHFDSVAYQVRIERLWESQIWIARAARETGQIYVSPSLVEPITFDTVLFGGETLLSVVQTNRAIAALRSETQIPELNPGRIRGVYVFDVLELELWNSEALSPLANLLDQAKQGQRKVLIIPKYADGHQFPQGKGKLLSLTVGLAYELAEIPEYVSAEKLCDNGIWVHDPIELAVAGSGWISELLESLL
jgi:hypothetical protein